MADYDRHHHGSRYLALRRAMLRADPLVCGLCYRIIDKNLKHPHPGSFQMDLIVPRSLGGSADPTNWRPSHRLCNIKRSNGKRKQNGFVVTDEDEP